jgi:hypothetical protein
MNTTMTNHEELDPINSFIHFLMQGIQSWMKAGDIAREQLKQDPDWGLKVAEKNKVVTAQAVARFANIGTKWIPELAISDCPGAKKLRNLPIQIQNEVFHSQVPLLIKSQDGWEVLKTDLHALSSDQAAQVFANDHVRTDSEQRAFIEDKKAKASSERADETYRIVGNEVIFMAGTRCKLKDLKRITEELRRRNR